jgi:hypothetical protein
MRRLVTCIVLLCDRCGAPLGCEGEMHFDTVDHMSRAAVDLGWSTDGKGRWHCEECPCLVDETQPAPVIDGQEAFELAEDPQERILRLAGLMPWRA